MKAYLELTQRGKAQRLRKLAIRALEDYALDVSRVRLVSNGFNGIFRVDTHDKHKYILRVTLPDSAHNLRQIHSEMIWLNALAQNTSITAPVPVRTTSGEWVTTVGVDGVPQARHCVLFSWVPGKDIVVQRTPETWRLFGVLSARLHQNALTFTPPDDFRITTYDTAFPLSERNYLFDEENRHFFTAEQFTLLQDAVERIQADIDRLYTENRAGLRVTHGDLHQWNVRMYRNSLSPIDFEDLMWAHPIQDLGITLYYNQSDDNYQALLASFKAGYETVAPFPEEYPGQLDVHILARRIHLLNFIFMGEEFSLSDFPDYIPHTIEQIMQVRRHVWRL